VETMKKLGSKLTFYYKKIFPLIWFGFLGVFLVVGLTSKIPTNGPGIMFILMPIFMATVGYIFMKKFIWVLMDEVYDEGGALLFRNKGQEVRVNLKDIKNVSYSVLTNPPRVTLSLRRQTDFGDELSFCPPASWIPFKKNKDIEELIERIDIARG
jgi:hypothetical protein